MHMAYANRQNKTALRLLNDHCICHGSENISSMWVMSSKMLPSQYGAISRAIHTTGNAPATAMRSSSFRLPCVLVWLSSFSYHQISRTVFDDLHDEIIDGVGGAALSDLLVPKEIECIDQDSLLILIDLQFSCSSHASPVPSWHLRYRHRFRSLACCFDTLGDHILRKLSLLFGDLRLIQVQLLSDRWSFSFPREAI